MIEAQVGPNMPSPVAAVSTSVAKGECGAAASGPADRPPALSVLVCTRNRAEKLARTLRSLVSLDTTRRYEVLVVDNKSTDGTGAIVEDLQSRLPSGFLRYVLEHRVGSGAARDRGWREARADIVAFTDDDCYVAPDYVDRLLNVFDNEPQTSFLAGQIRLYDPEDRPVTIDLRQAPVAIAPYAFVHGTSVAAANLSFRRTALEMIGGFDPLLGAGTPFPCEDLDAVARAAWAGLTGKFDPGPVVFHHHGRRTRQDVAKLFREYDRGRGAYFMKFIMRRDSRAAYLRAYCQWLLRDVRRPGDIRRIYREATSAIAYFRASRAEAIPRDARGHQSDLP
jgi:glycosyltransferase involved in cell wall biosynthesis